MMSKNIKTLGHRNQRPNSRWRGDVQVRVKATALSLGQMGEKFFKIKQPIFKKQLMRTQKTTAIPLFTSSYGEC